MTNQKRWEDATLTSSERAEALLSSMSFEDKVNLVTGKTDELVHLGIPSLEKVDASCGLRGDTGVTAFPVPIALSATFDADLAYEYGTAIAKEARDHGWSIILGPTVDVERRGNSGRLSEGYGEDPTLNGIIGERVARGMIDQHTIPCIKHFTAYNQETNRNHLNVNVSQRVLHELYNAPFYHLIHQEAALSIMGSYPKINGTYACENAELLDALRAETGWQGFMMSDFMAGDDPVAGFNAGMDTSTLYPDFPPEAFSDGRISADRVEQAVKRTLFAIFESGLYDHPVDAGDKEVNVSTPDHRAIAQRTAAQSMVLLKNRDDILPLSRENLHSIAVIGCAQEDIITGVEGSTYVIPGDYVAPLDAIRDSVGDGTQILFAQGSHGDHPLPPVSNEFLTAVDGQSTGLTGTFYANPDFEGEPFKVETVPQLDFSAAPFEDLPPAWSARFSGKITSPVEGMVNFSLLASGMVKLFVDGKCIISGTRETPYFVTEGYYFPLLGSVEMQADTPVEIVVEISTPMKDLDFVLGKHLHLGWQPEQLIDEAVEVAKQADVAVVFVNQSTGEGMDRDHFTLPGDQNRLIEAVTAANANTIVILNTSGAILMPWIDRVAAVLQIWYPGVAVGTSIASVLFGDAEPGGRLPVTFLATEKQILPAYDGGESVTFSEDVFVGYRYYQKNGFKPLFPFGYGLSYTQFEYRDLMITYRDDPRNVAEAQITVKNVGDRSGAEIVQVYVGALPIDLPIPPKQLVGFARVNLDPHESKSVTIAISRQRLSYWDADAASWQLPAGDISVYVGSSSEAEHLVGMFSL